MTLPRGWSLQKVPEVLQQRAGWIRKHLSLLQATPGEFPAHLSRPETAYREEARRYFTQRTRYWAERMGVTFGRITIREQKTRWGSCSRQGNLNFNWRLILAPPPVIDYVIVHELAHRLHLNHSPAFWATVGRHLPDFARHRRWLKENGHRLWQYTGEEKGDVPGG